LNTIWKCKQRPAKVKKDELGGLRFCYEPLMHYPGSYCVFSLWCEVGEPYKHWFKGFFELHQLDEKHQEYPERPWLADRLIPKKNKQT